MKFQKFKRISSILLTLVLILSLLPTGVFAEEVTVSNLSALQNEAGTRLMTGEISTTVGLGGNPYLPLWEHLPDSEPKVFEDSDNPGKYRVYIYGSHDVTGTDYCGPDIRCWSAPVEDLGTWRDEGPVFTNYISSQWDAMYVPDIVEVMRFEPGIARTSSSKRTIKEYYLYLNSRSNSGIALIAKGASPVGPFTILNGDGMVGASGRVLGYYPSVWVDYTDDPNDPDYAIGFRAYAYWGRAGSDEKSRACELDQATMYSARPGRSVIQYFIPCSPAYGTVDSSPSTYPYVFPGENYKDFNFSEALSVRKIGNKYIMVYSGYSGPDYGMSSTKSSLRYCYGDTPLGPWKFGGVLADSRGPVPDQNGTALAGGTWEHNIHGSLCEINGQWYVFYHRSPRGYGYARQPMVAPVKVSYDTSAVADGGKVSIRAYDPYSDDNTWTAKAGKNEYTGVEITSEGFMIYGLDPYQYYSAGITSYVLGTATLQDSWDIWDNHMPITGVSSGDIIGYKYFGFGGLDEQKAIESGIRPFEGSKPGNNTKFNLFLTPRTTSAFTVNVWLDGPWNNTTWKGKQIGTINVPAGSEQVPAKFTIDVSSHVDNLDGKHAIFLVASDGSGDLFDMHGLGFSSDTVNVERPAMPALSVLVNGSPITLPTTPVRSTESNGIVGYDNYQYTGMRPDGTPVITASASDPDAFTIVTQSSAENSPGTVRYIYNGVEKKYWIFSGSFDGTKNAADPPDVAAVKKAAEIIGKNVTVLGAASDTPTQLSAKAQIALEAAAGVGELAVTLNVTYESNAYALTITRGSTSATISPFEVSAQLIANGGFEDADMSMWDVNDIATISRTNAQHASGEYSAYVTGRTATGSGPAQFMPMMNAPLVKGGVYEVSCKVYYDEATAQDSPNNKQFWFNIKGSGDYVGGDGGYNSVRNMSGVSAAKGLWSTISGTYTVPNDLREPYINVFVETDYANSPSATEDLFNFYVDDISIIVVSEPMPPMLTAGEGNRTSDSAATIGFTTDKAGTAYYLVMNSGEKAPTKEAVCKGTSLGYVSDTVSGKPVALTAGAKDIYVIVEDAAGNISSPLKIEVAAYEPDSSILDISTNGINEVTVTLSRTRQDAEVLVIAVYNENGKIVALNVDNTTEGNIVPIAVTISSDARRIKAMWWDGINTMLPLCEAKTMEYEDGMWKWTLEK